MIKIFVIFVLLVCQALAEISDFQTNELNMQRGLNSLLRFLENPQSATSPFVCSDDSSELLQMLCGVGRIEAMPDNMLERSRLINNACVSFDAQDGMRELEAGQNEYMQAASAELEETGERLRDEIYEGVRNNRRRMNELSLALANLNGYSTTNSSHTTREKNDIACVLLRDPASVAQCEPQYESAHNALAIYYAFDNEHDERLNKCYLSACPQDSGACSGGTRRLRGSRPTCSNGVRQYPVLQIEIDASIRWANNNQDHQCVRLCRGLNRVARSLVQDGRRGSLYSDDNLQRLRGMRDELRAQFAQVINQLNVPDDIREEMLRKLRRIDIGAPNLSHEEWGFGLNGYCMGQPGHGHSAGRSLIILSPGFMAMLGSEQGRAMVMRTLAHEMGHAIDRREDGSGASSFSWNSQSSTFNSCLTENWHIDSYRTSNTASLFRETFADNISSMVMERRYEAELASTIPREQSFQRKALLTDICTRIRRNVPYSSSSTHPNAVDRITSILQGVHARRLLGCTDQPNRATSIAGCRGN